jgi:hypothetical protein
VICLIYTQQLLELLPVAYEAPNSSLVMGQARGVGPCLPDTPSQRAQALGA